MRPQAREVYGFGPALPTRSDRLVRFARIVLVTAVTGTVVALLISN